MGQHKRLFLAPILCALVVCFAWMFAFNVHAEDDVMTVSDGGQIYVDNVKDIDIAENTAYKYQFIPEETAEYIMYSEGNTDTYVKLLDNDGEYLYGDDDGGKQYNFCLTTELEEGETYYFVVSGLDGVAGPTTITLKKNLITSPIVSISYKPASPIEFIVGGEDSTTETDDQDKEYFYYSLYARNGDILTVNYENNVTKEYKYDSEDRVFACTEDGTFVKYVSFIHDQYDNHWGLGDHTVTVCYDGWETTITATVKESDESIANKVTDMINALGQNPSEAAVQAARKAYAALTDPQKALVTKDTIGLLESAEKKIADDKAKKAAEEQAKKDAEEKAKAEQAKKDAEAKAKAEQAKKDAEAKAKAEQAKKDAEAKAKAEQAKKKSIRVTKITINGISHNIAVGKKIKLTATVLPKNATNKKVKWTTSNKKIATVNQKGLVTIKKKTGGKTVTIKATATDGSKKSKTWKIKVMKGVVKSVTIKGAKKQLKVNKTMKLKTVVKASKGANKKVKWTSSNKKFATVSSAGKVKALKAGKGKTVKITAQATDGSGKKKVVKIKIK